MLNVHLCYTVEASTGAMGGSRSHEFQLVAAVGEDTILQCTQ